MEQDKETIDRFNAQVLRELGIEPTKELLVELRMKNVRAHKLNNKQEGTNVVVEQSGNE